MLSSKVETTIEEADSLDQDGRSDFARELEKIKEDTLAAAERRTHLPQPLFWSLFHARLAELKAAKKTVRELEEIFLQKL